MALPMLERAGQDDARFCYTGVKGLVNLPSTAPARIPDRMPGEGEQYRFHFDMTKCIGCKCCEVACNEQNGNPADIRWRRVGEVESGEFPHTLRSYLSMGCNHCLDAACLKGCPVDAYTKDPVTGIVLHSADACIGCQYCTWNCPYGVPQFNPERGVVGKCDLCYGRLTDSREPACVSACPQGAIEVEIVNVAAWRKELVSATSVANAPGMPPAEATLSTTRITAPPAMRDDFEKGDYHRVRPEHPHWPLVFVLVLTQLSAGAFLLAGLLGLSSPFSLIAPVTVLHAALGVTLLHLGRPAYAWRALKMWRRSWLSREVLAFSVFAATATPAAGALALGMPYTTAMIWAAAAAGIAGVVCSAAIYMVPARPSWHTPATLADFVLTGGTLAPLALGLTEGWEMAKLALVFGAAQVLLEVGRLIVMRRSQTFELRQSARLLTADFAWVFRARLLLGFAPVLPWISEAPAATGAALGLALLGLIASRYLFFVTVVPRNMAATFFGTAREAA